VLEQQLRSLFAYFEAFTVPTAVFATDDDFDGAALRSPLVRSNAALAAHQAARIARRSLSSPPPRPRQVQTHHD
jgi:FMN reductase